MQSRIAVGISLPKELLIKIDADRGDIPRSRYVLRILQKLYLGEEE
jgi:metal-responsive CopG/Arc/MetJ family transcriptional regulator